VASTLSRGIFACILSACALGTAALAPAAEVKELQGKVAAAREQAGAIAAELRDTRSRLAASEAEAEAAAARAEELTALLAGGRERAARLALEVSRSERRLAAERERLRRARRALAQRLVAIYVSGSPGTTSVVFEAIDFGDLATRAGYLERIETSDRDLASRTKEVRDAVRAGLRRVGALKRRVDVHNEELATARSEVAGVRERAAAAAAELESIEAVRRASLATLDSKIEEWIADIEAAKAASRAAAEAAVERWLGGPYSIPTYIVMCESGGDYGALNPSSGAGGAYQIIPSTWEAYGGEGAPHEAPKAEQDRIAAEIWADSGGSAWVCA
jgi:peptidoglycan hydrolase CwlO-like protein